MAKVFIDNQAYEMDSSQNLLHGCLQLGFDLPYFCWHPAMGSVGACRQCAVKQFKDENDTRGKLVMACMTPAAEGTRIAIQDPDAVEFRRAVIEGLMLNHPHDCPVCDEGGECHLQDMTVMTGHDYRRYSFEKRTFRNQYLGPFVNHEMNRCIQCYRCVRFYREYAGGHDLNSFALRNIVFFGREKDGVLESEFAGNLVEVCPTGVFTDATLKHHFTRKWDLQFAPSICVHCGLGCNVSAAERYGTVRRIVNRYNHEVNGYFLCDRGRYGYDYPRLVRPAPAVDLKALAANAIGIGSPRASLESNFALRALVGPDRFYAGIPGNESRLLARMLEILREGPRTPSLRDIEESDAVFILGEDISNTAARMALTVKQTVRQQPMQIAEKLKIPLWMDHAVREALQDARGPLFIASTAATRLDSIATRTFRGTPDDLARLDYADLVSALKAAQRPVIISGPSNGSLALIEAAARMARAIPNATLAFTTPECNSFGLAMMNAPALDAAFQANAENVIILENDLYRRAPAGEVDSFLAKFRNVIVLDCIETATTAKGTEVLPAAGFAEGDGTLVSSEGRAQRFFQVYVPPEPVRESWRWLGWETLDEVIGAMSQALPQFAPAADAAPSARCRLAGEKVPREPHRFSGRTAMRANINVSEAPPPPDPDTPLAFSMEGYPQQPPSPLIPFFWAPRWNSIQSLNKFQEEIAGPLRGGDPGVRLFEGGGTSAGAELPSRSPSTAPEPGDFLIVPVYHIFGSEELSRLSPAVAQLAPEPYVALNPEDASAIGPNAVVFGHRVPVKPDPSLVRGVAGAPYGIPPFAGIELPQRSRIERAQ